MTEADLSPSKLMTQRVAKALRVGCVLPLETTMRLYGGTDKGEHLYVPFYRRHLGDRRWRRNRVLEIGIGGYESRTPGGSLRIWRDHFPFSRIVGLDIYDKDVKLGGRVSFVRGDQSSEADLTRVVDRLGGAPDIVIDDGSHQVEHAEASFRYLFPLMPPGGVYVIEDLHTSYWSDFGGDVPAPKGTAVNLAKSLVDAVQANDVTFTFPKWLEAARPISEYHDAWSISIYPGIVFVQKAGNGGLI